MESAFRSIQVPEERKLSLMQGKLQGFAFTYFQTEEMSHPAMTYLEFKQKMRDRYFPQAMRRARENEVRDAGFEDFPVDEIIRRLRDDLAEVPKAATMEDFKISLS